MLINQTKLLKALLKPQFMVENFSYLSHDLFDDPIENIVAMVIILYFKQYREIPPIEDLTLLLCEDKKRPKEEIALIGRKLLDIYEPNELQGLNFLSDQVREFCGIKRLKDLCLQVEERTNQNEDIDKILPYIYKELSSLGKGKESELTINQDSSFLKWQDYQVNLPKYRMATGFPILDKRMKSGIGKGELFLIVVGAKILAFTLVTV